LDEEVAAVGLEDDPPLLLKELDWLQSDAAVRSGPFLFHVGRLDTELKLLEPLIGSMATRPSVNNLSSYIGGIATVLTEDKLDSILALLMHDATHSGAFVLSLRSAGLTDRRVQWLRQLLEDGAINSDALTPLEYTSWTNVSSNILTGFLNILTAEDSGVARTIALQIATDEAKRLAKDDTELLATILRKASEGPVKGKVDPYYWEIAAKKLLEQGQTEITIQAAIRFIAENERYRGDQGAWEILIEATDKNANAVWEALVPLIERHDDTAFQLVLEIQTHRLLRRLPAASIMAWVGRDERRATWIALMCSVQDAILDEVTRELLVRFGPESKPAKELSARAGSTDGVVSSLADHAKKQAENARQWARDEDPNVSEWGRRMIDQLGRSYEYHAAWEEFQDRQG
jgi:hypothetical protein